MGTELHVIFGTGAVGLATVDALRRRGRRTVRLVNRSGQAPVPDGVEVAGGDASDPAFATDAARGAAVVYQTMNPPYPEWGARFPALQTGILAAAETAGARLVSMENVYMYGRPNGHPLTETRANNAHTKKGRLRARMSQELLAAHDAGRVQVAIGRASDYFGPRGGAQSNLGDRVFPAALAGKTANVLGNPDKPRAKLRAMPPLLLRGLSLINPTVRELLEMEYQFEEPFIVDSMKIAGKLGLKATPMHQALAETLLSYRLLLDRGDAGVPGLTKPPASA